MKNIKKLSKEQQTNINGGSGSNSFSGSGEISVSTDSLLSVTLETQHGDSTRKTTLSAGNDIDARATTMFGNSEL